MEVMLNRKSLGMLEFIVSQEIDLNEERKLQWGGQSNRRKFRIKRQKPKDKNKKGAAHWLHNCREVKIESELCTLKFSQGIIGDSGKSH